MESTAQPRLSGVAVFFYVFLPFALGHYLSSLLRSVNAVLAPALVVNRLAARLIGQEELAARHGADLKSQQAINRIVIADVDDGILVVGRDGRAGHG